MHRARPSLFERIPTSARTWASRLLLLLASASVVATSQPSTDDVASEPLPGTPIRITTDEPSVTRTLVVRVTAKDDSSLWVLGSLELHARAKWTPDDPAPTTNPWLFVRQIEDTFTHDARSVVLEPGATVSIENRAALSATCRLNQGCEWTVPFAFYRENHEFTGTVDIEWTAQATLHVENEANLPQNFTVTVSER